MKSFRRTSLALLFALLHASEAVAGWELRHSTSANDTYVDRTTIRKVGNYWQILVLSNLPAPNQFGTTSLRILDEYDCSEHRHRMLRIQSYSGQMGAGKLLSTHELTDGWTNIYPGSSFASISRLICQEQ